MTTQVRVRWHLLKCDEPGCESDLHIPPAHQYQSFETIVRWSEGLGWRSSGEAIYCATHAGDLPTLP